MTSLLVKNASFTVTQNPSRQVLEGFDVYCEDGVIKKVGKNLNVRASKKVDAKGKALIPGLVNAHTHLGMTLLRGYSDDKELHEWLSKDIWPLEAKFDDRIFNASSLLGAVESISFGTTTVNDMYSSEDPEEYAAALVLDEVGLRGSLAWGVIGSMGDFSKKVKHVKSYLKAWKNKSDLVSPAVGPHAIYTCSKEQLLELKSVAEEFKAPLHLHLSETRREVFDCWKAHGLRPVDYLEKIGFLDSSSHITAAHCGWLSKAEMQLLGKRRIGVAHCPNSNMKLATGGVMDLVEMHNSKVSVGLGTDSTASNNNLDLFEEMKQCALIQKHFRWDATVADAQTVLDLATIEGAKAIGMEKKIGSIEVGKKADFALVDLKKPHLTPVFGAKSLVSHLVYAAKGQDVTHTIVNGKVLMEDREFLTVEEDSLYAAVDKARERLLK